MTLNELIAYTARYRREHPEQRIGQAAFNAVCKVEPEVANLVRATDLDPFYRDERLPAFWAEVAGFFA
jgi:hypothetical protein